MTSFATADWGADVVAFEGATCLARGPLAAVALQVKAAIEERPGARLMVFNAQTSEILDFDHRGTQQEVLARLALTHAPAVPAQGQAAEGEGESDSATAKTGPGRPKLGVVAREVTLLPRHWAWLAGQPGGASVALRKLVEQARKDSLAQDQLRMSQEASYRFMSAMSAMAGSLAGFEEAARALFAADRLRFEALIAPWPVDVQSHLLALAQVALVPQLGVNPSEAPHA